MNNRYEVKGTDEFFLHIRDNDEWPEDKDEGYIGDIWKTVDILNKQDQRIKELEEQLKLVCKADSLMTHDSVKEIIRDAIRGLDTVTENSSTAFDHYVVLDKVFKEQYNNEYWDNYE